VSVSSKVAQSFVFLYGHLTEAPSVQRWLSPFSLRSNLPIYEFPKQVKDRIAKTSKALADYAPGFPRVTKGARITPALENESLLQSPKEKQITKGNGMNTGQAR
jgi:hypothetical protein